MLQSKKSHPSLLLNKLLMYFRLFYCVISLCMEAYYLFENTRCMPLYFMVLVLFVGRYTISLEQIPDVWIYYDTQPWPSEDFIFNHSVYAFSKSNFCSILKQMEHSFLIASFDLPWPDDLGCFWGQWMVHRGLQPSGGLPVGQRFKSR